MADSSSELKKPATGVKKTPSFKAESETQTAVAVRVPSLKKPPLPGGVAVASEKLVTVEAQQAQNAAVARRRRMLAKNRAQNVRTRDKTPEAHRTPIPVHDDTTTTDEEDVKTAKSPHEAESDDVYEEMRRKLQEKTREKDEDDIDIEKIREAHAEQIKERRRRSISPFALPTADEIAGLQRKDDTDPVNRKNSLILSAADVDAITTALNASSTLTAPERNKQLITPPSLRKPQDTTRKTDKPAQNPKEVEKATQRTPTTNKQTNMPQPKPKSCIKAPTNVTDPHPPSPSGTMQTFKDGATADVPPVRPKRSKSGTRSQGRTSESEMSEDQSRPKVVPQPQPQKAPKPKERRKTIATTKKQIPERSPTAKRSKSATRVDQKLDTAGIEMTKTSSGIIELLQKARNSSISIPDEDERISSAVKAYVDRSRELNMPTNLPTSPRRSRGISCPKTIEIISGKEIIDSFKQAQRRSMEMERSRRSSGYIDASQSELTSSCYSSSYSEDESDFDLSKKSAELNRKLALLHSDTSGAKKDNDKPAQATTKGPDKKVAKETKKDTKKTVAKVDEKPITIEDLKSTNYKWMRQNCRRMWKEFRAEHTDESLKIRRLWNRCFSDLVILMIFCGMGGMLFRYTEGAFENFYKCGVKRVKRDFIDSLWQGSHNLREDDWKSMARNKLWEFETQLHTAHEAGVHSYSGQKAWSFMNSVVYCLTVITTIGYGHIAPSTKTGRAITIVYAIIGIPIFLILLADFGKLFTRCIKFVWAFVRRLYYTGSCRKVRRTVPVQEVMKGLNMVYEAASTLRRASQFGLEAEEDPEKPPKLPEKPKSSISNTLSVPGSEEKRENVEEMGEDPALQTPAPSVVEIDDEFNLPISIAIVILLIYILVGASIYVVWEDWGFFDSFYFVFISMSTIGFGDFVPNHPMYMMGSIVYLVFGMALTSMCINVVQAKLSDSFRQASAKIGATIGLKVSEEDGSLAAITPPPVEIPSVHATAPKTPELGDASQMGK